MLQLYTLKIRKGFPFGLELSGDFGYLAQTSMVFGGADVRISLLEGFRTGIPAIFPEIAVGGSVRTITGARAVPAHGRELRRTDLEAHPHRRHPRGHAVRRLPVDPNLR